MSNNLYRNKEQGLYKRLAFDAALAIGILGFTISLWKIPGFIQFITALCIGVVAALVTFFIVLYAGKFLHTQVEEQSNQNDIRDQRAGLGLAANIEHAESSKMSIHTKANYETNPDGRAQRTNLTTTLPRHWSNYLVDNIEWRVFDRLCIAFWRLKGNKISGIAERTTDGIDFFISAPTNKQFRIAVVQTRSSQANSPSIEDINNLLRLKEKNNLSVAILMYADKLSNVVHSYCVSNDVRLFDSDNITKGIKGLAKRDQEQLFKALIRPDYMVPSCPSCLIKLVRRQSVKSGRIFWGCVSYPKCNFTISN